jgi:small nuclear ribonucleoprotein
MLQKNNSLFISVLELCYYVEKVILRIHFKLFQALAFFISSIRANKLWKRINFLANQKLKVSTRLKLCNKFIYYLKVCFLIYLGCMNMEATRPLDSLNAARNKRVIVELKNSKQYVGILKAFDIHVNVVLEGAEERNEGNVTRKLGVVFVRGDAIVLISPE